MPTPLSITKNIESISQVKPGQPYVNPLMEESISYAKNVADNYSQPRKNVERKSFQQSSPQGVFETIAKQQQEERKQNLQSLPEEKQPIEQKNIDYDKEPYGFDESDKMAMLGSMAVGGALGIPDMVVGAAQLFGRGASLGAKGIGAITGQKETYEGIANIIDEGTKNITNWYERKFHRNKLVMNAQASHPIAFELSNLAANIAPTASFLKGAGLMAKGEALTEDAAKAINDVEKVYSKIGGKDSYVKSLAAAVKNAGAKSVINAKNSITARKLSQWVGEGVAFNELQFDPENNHYIASDILAGSMALAFGASGKLISGFASPLAKEIEKINKDWGISLNPYPKLEKYTKYLTGSGYGKMIMDRAKQVTAKAKELKSFITEGSDEEIQKDLSGRISNVEKELKDEKLEFYKKDKLSNELKSLKEQQEQISKGKGYSKYLFGVTKDAHATMKKEYQEMDNKMYNSVDRNSIVDISHVREVAQDIINKEEGILKGVRRERLIRMAQDYLDPYSLSPATKKINQVFKQLGIYDKDKAADILEDLINGNLYKTNPQLNRLLSPHTLTLTDMLFKEKLPSGGIDKSDLAQFLTGDTVTLENLRNTRTAIGNKWRSAADSVTEGKLGRIYGALSTSLENHFIKSGNQEGLNLFRASNKLYHDKIAPLKNIIDEYSNKGQKSIDKFIGEFLKPDEPEEMRKILDKMPEGDGRARLALKAAVMHEAYNRATVEGIGLNAAKFVDQLKKLKEVNNVVFSEEENKVLNGYEKLINRIEKISPKALIEGVGEGWPASAESAKNILKETGLKGLTSAALGFAGFTVGSGYILPMMITGSVFGKLVNSQKGRKFLMALASANENETLPLLKNVIKYVGLYPAIEEMHKVVDVMNRQ